MAPSNSGRRTTSLVTTVVVAVLTAAVWWLQGGADGSDGSDAGQDPAPTYSDTSAPNTDTSPTNTDTSPTNTDTSPTNTDTSPTNIDTSAVDEVSGLPYVALEALPPEARATVELIDEGGPFPYEKDGSTFGNYEGLLPDHEDGYYREYTVDTPGSDDRGARRIVGGAEGELYWTEDHYESFEVIWR